MKGGYLEPAMNFAKEAEAAGAAQASLEAEAASLRLMR
jgi:hypothetical protein